uniref:Uncharacterized protein n=1 Tax=Vannella robusta TaxID=1487602 RepID=A0A7S4IRL1_9EUKA|mmetsp:Transcript_7456/g.9206  ORF Transcript_7456/g.9206 Transcript_7456/m.9206 type:complete len:175 (+) Transcript_7456:72-596(+)
MGRVAKYKKVKKFDLYDEKTNSLADKPSRKKDKTKLPNSFRTMKYQKERAERIERIRAQQRITKEKEKTKVEKPENDTMFEGKRDDESFRDFNKRLTEETREALSGIRTRKRMRSNYMRHRKEKKREKKKKKKEEKELDAKETRRDVVGFGEIVDRPPILQIAPKMKKRLNQHS